ncbi:MAG TPA: NAD(P)H-binding protein [bacterium (Candidatus Stahlbacteria)]|nr:NAD(P)H-binding protein [Candidatus Stahlbacteria bacterium]
MDNRYIKQILFSKIGKQGQEKLLNSSVVIVGCGALGSVIANNLTRTGVGKIKIVDRDFVELDNLQRQILFDEEDARKSIPKAIAAVEKLKRINSTISLEAKVCDVNSTNIEEIIDDVDIVLDGTDNMETRFLINDACVKNNIPWIYGAAIGATGLTMNIIPGKTPCLRCVIAKLPPAGALPTCETAGVLNTITNIVASLETSEAIKMLVGDESINRKLIYFDVWNSSLDKIGIRRDKDCPTCVKGEFSVLNAEEISWSAVLCGRNAVQVRPPKQTKISLENLGQQLAKVGEVVHKGYVLFFKIDSYELIIFPDARAIIKGTTDIPMARSLYAKYIGI